MPRTRAAQSGPPDEDGAYELGERDDLAAPEASTIRRELKRKRIGALVGASLLQLPIWGFAMSYGVFQEYFASNWTLKGSQQVTGIVGTTSNGVMYLSMPVLFALFSRQWARWRQTAAVAGAVLTGLSFLLSSFSTHVWHLVATQGVLAALGCALVYSPTTLSLGEWFNNTGRRAVAYGIVLSCKNVVGSACPLLFRALLDHCSLRVVLLVWMALAVGTSIPAVFLVPTPSFSISSSDLSPDDTHRRRQTPLRFLSHGTIYVYSAAIMLQSCGYGISQTYLNEYAHDVVLLSRTSATLLLTLFNVPGIASSSFFGYLSDNKHYPLSATATTAISAVGSTLAALLLWGLATRGSMALLALFSVVFGFFAGGYSATWGGILNELEKEAASANEPVDPGLLYGLLNGARGVGYVGGGLISVPLLKAGWRSAGNLAETQFGYGTAYGPLIIFTGLSSAFGGWAVLWKCKGR